MLVPNPPKQILDTWAKKPLDFEPGTQWQYSNTNFVIAGRIVEQITATRSWTSSPPASFAPSA